MNAPLLWIILPLVAAVLLWLIRANRFLVVFTATLVCLLLSLAAWLFPIGGIVRLGPLVTEISPAIFLFGRRFVLQDTDRLLLVYLYLFGAFWFFGEGILRKNPLFVPIGLATLSLSIAALAVEPFLYAALIIEMIVLLSIPVLVTPGTRVGQGVLRFLIFQTLAMVFILFAGWAAGGVEADPTNESLLVQTLVFFGLGFAFWLAVFPFYTWIPLLVSETRPYQAFFLVNFLQQVVLLLLLDYLNAFSWLRQFSMLPDLFKLLGVIMIASGGLWAAFQRNLNRLFGYAVIVEIGFSLLAIGLRTRVGYELYVAMFLPRMIVLALGSMALSTLNSPSFDFTDIGGLLRKKPVSGVAILMALFSFSGLPLLANFPLRQVLLENLAQQSPIGVYWAIAGVGGLLLASIRVLLVFSSSDEQGWQWSEDWRPVTLLVIGILAVVLWGTIPALFPGMQGMLGAFTNLTY